ncbi:MAG: nucleotide exchange factor GrpE [Acidimicrobiales bacterium]|jgi:molecular chaperone GrpE (heat shock protein)
MPSNGSRHQDDALGSAGGSGSGANSGNRDRGEGEALAPEHGATGAGIPNVFEGLSPDLTVGEDGPEEIVRLAKERDEVLDTLRHLQADFENYKKRVERQSQELRDRANERLVEALLPALDAFGMARAHLSDSDASPETKALLQAASLFESALQKEGLERIVAEGVPFDPSSHEAVDHVAADHVAADHVSAGNVSAGNVSADGAGSESDIAEGEIVGDGPDVSETSDAGGSHAGPTVDAVFRPGYVWKGRVIRPAMVRVRG